MTRVHVTVDRAHADACVRALIRLGLVNVNRERAEFFGVVSGDASEDTLALLRALSLRVAVDGERSALEAREGAK